ncbi:MULTISPECIES: PorP/SprF family type IX secretion system membrane protein [Mucilaginibacter]|uniref:Type IX secretion system membrane protein PorP/SprF n=2 Tax=Mucilaginibacter TaxID=423349 RepID=A0AAE6JFD7_9SPHI|nr:MULTISPECIES: type IX secretion system membrane protein PorP/SprF [Mucilaginibacter]QEM04005.1 type IX secretion system membrane protein PorP/SprF [Mucilaginibacter rubeus]QTE38433.1 type IX secretion system membrane protein PorP/SprF [Mucilaginibacter gossypii]QTE40610.1 type IX secretion system membrane protein PorP/SprF [Mucilaginibacter rubeus]QTE47212.1 type IX secretion system membrane protein PorP/SprF [Mucilaginibacter rubeus]QTE58605.1 type IX secretion system membrane protein PorP
MKRILYTLLIIAVTIQLAKAQQRPQYTQYVFNNYLLNPALSGIENYTDVKLGYRSQWTGLEGAPVTSYFSVNAPIGNRFLQGDATAFPAGGGLNPSSRSYTQNYMAAEPHHGVGLMVVSDKTGPITQTNIDATYAYHLGLTETLNLAVGVSAGVSHNIIDKSKLTYVDQNDPTINSIAGAQWKPDLGVGVWAYSSNYFFGASVQQILPQNLYVTTSTTAVQNKTVPHYFVTGGVKLFVSDDITLMPSALLKFIAPVPVTFDVNMKMSFKDRFWIGGSYRRNDSYAALVGFNLSSLINVGYSYDFTTSALNTVSHGSHEIVLGILLNNRYKVTCPQHTF